MSKKSLITFFAGLIIGSVSLSYATWTTPTQTPPNGNTPAPVNVGTLAQDKAGVLTLGGLGVFGSTLITPTGGYTLPSSLSLGVNGYVGAKGYCDEKGENCALSPTGASAGWVDVSLADSADFNPRCVYRFSMGGDVLFYPSAAGAKTLYWNIGEYGDHIHYILSNNKASLRYKFGTNYGDTSGGVHVVAVTKIEKYCAGI